MNACALHRRSPPGRTHRRHDGLCARPSGVRPARLCCVWPLSLKALWWTTLWWTTLWLTALSAAAKSPDMPAALVREAAATLVASAVEPPTWSALADAGLRALAGRHPCLTFEVTPEGVDFRCEGRARGREEAPRSARDLQALLWRAASAAGVRRPSLADAQAVARALGASPQDPYTAYLSPRVVARLQQPVVATPGLELTPRDPALVREVRPGSFAARAGIAEGDRLLAIDGHPVALWNLAELSAAVAGSPGTALRVTFRPAGGSGERSALLMRDHVPEPVVAEHRLPGGALYVRVSSFAPRAAGLVQACLWEHQPRGLVLDLRHNPGGLVQEAVALVDLLLDEGPIGGVRARPGRPAEVFHAQVAPGDWLAPLVVLIDGGSASAAELAAWVLQERGRASLVGSVSLGKGSVQQVVALPDGGAMRVTTAHYVGARGEALPPDGVSPDIHLPRSRGRTVLEGASPERDSWVLYALDLLAAPRFPRRHPIAPRGPVP